MTQLLIDIVIAVSFCVAYVCMINNLLPVAL